MERLLVHPHIMLALRVRFNDLCSCICGATCRRVGLNAPAAGSGMVHLFGFGHDGGEIGTVGRRPGLAADWFERSGAPPSSMLIQAYTALNCSRRRGRGRL